jgi:hypothetical protein
MNYYVFLRMLNHVLKYEAAYQWILSPFYDMKERKIESKNMFVIWFVSYFYKDLCSVSFYICLKINV